MSALHERHSPPSGTADQQDPRPGPDSPLRPDIRLVKVSKSYGDHFALRNVSLEIAPRSSVALLGSNGAGKTTLLGVIAGLVSPSAGEVTVRGRLAGRSRRETGTAVGVLTHKTMLYEPLTGRENLALHAALRNISPGRIDFVLEQVALTAAADRPAGEYSHGMRKRLALARALLHDPAVLILDEPFSGLDPESQHRLSCILETLRQLRTILFSTHDLERAARYADRLLVLKAGRIVWERWRDPLRNADHLLRDLQAAMQTSAEKIS